MYGAAVVALLQLKYVKVPGNVVNALGHGAALICIKLFYAFGFHKAVLQYSNKGSQKMFFATHSRFFGATPFSPKKIPFNINFYFECFLFLFLEL